MGAVLWSVMLHAVLCTTQPPQPLHEASPIEPPEPPVDDPSPSGYPAAPVGDAEWSLSLSSITLSDSNDKQLPSMV